MSHHDDDIIGTRTKRDQLAGLELFESVRQVEATARPAAPEPPPPAPAEREVQQTSAFTGGMSDAERLERIGRIKHALREPLIDLARVRVDRAEEPGVTAKDAREIAERKGLSGLLGDQQRAWSWLSSWLGQLARESALVKYQHHGMVVKRMGDNGNEQVVYLHPYDRRARGDVVAA